ncbi:MAG: enoyl-CoA hydratase-related protein [Pseudomonadota bacterium]|nr:enoyl-CoA hydratase-related protein [Pseudomonadota bacterium]
MNTETQHDYFQLGTPTPGVAHLVLSRPERLNTMSPPFFHALRDAVHALDARGDVRALVISATGKHFCAGMALDVFAGMGDGFATATPRDRMGFAHMLAQLMDCFTALEAARFPVICAVQGGCTGGGLDLAAACDIRVCTADAFFALQETQIGMAADLGVLQRLPKIIPEGVVRQMAYTAERLPAARALDVGLVNAVLPDADALHAHALALAANIAGKSPAAVAVSKTAITYARDHATPEALHHMAVLQSAVFDPAEMAEAIAAWQGKRAGSFAPLKPLATLTQVAPLAGPAQDTTQAASPTQASSGLSAASTVKALLAHPGAQAVLEQHLPGFSAHPQIAMAQVMPLATVARLSGGFITDEALQRIDAALKALG